MFVIQIIFLSTTYAQYYDLQENGEIYNLLQDYIDANVTDGQENAFDVDNYIKELASRIRLQNQNDYDQQSLLFDPNDNPLDPNTYILNPNNYIDAVLGQNLPDYIDYDENGVLLHDDFNNQLKPHLVSSNLDNNNIEYKLGEDQYDASEYIRVGHKKKTQTPAKTTKKRVAKLKSTASKKLLQLEKTTKKLPTTSKKNHKTTKKKITTAKKNNKTTKKKVTTKTKKNHPATKENSKTTKKLITTTKKNHLSPKKNSNTTKKQTTTTKKKHPTTKKNNKTTKEKIMKTTNKEKNKPTTKQSTKTTKKISAATKKSHATGKTTTKTVKTTTKTVKTTTKTVKTTTKTVKTTTIKKKIWQKYHYKRHPTYNYSETYFSVLPEYERNTTRAQESQYPWIARVVHSRTNPYPHVATAACIDTRIFITAARSVSGIKVNYTSVLYSGAQLPVMSIILPSTPSKQQFDDIGILVVKDGLIAQWHTIKPMQIPRTDEYFNWFEDLQFESQPMQHKAVGYAVNKDIHKVKTVYSKPELMELDVVLGVEICVTSYSVWDHLPGAFHVPCFYPCTSKEFFNIVNNSIPNNKCQKYLGVEGAVVFNTKTNTLMAIATWGEITFSMINFELPVGVALPNSKSFLEDYECAKKIREDNSTSINSGYYQKLCGGPHVKLYNLSKRLDCTNYKK